VNLQQRIYHSLSAISLGILTVGLQVLFLRTLLDIFQGNELTIGLFLSVWLLGSSLGSLAFFKFADRLKFKLTLIYGVLPLTILEYFLIKFVPAIFRLTPGGAYNIFTIFLIILMIILPLTIWCGALFPLLVGRMVLGKASVSFSAVKLIYIWESAGSLIIALLLNFVLFENLPDIRILFLVLFIFFVIQFLFQKSISPHTIQSPALFSFSVISLILLLFGNPIAAWLNQKSYPHYTVEEEKDTPYGHIKVLQLEQQEFVLNQGVILYSLPDPVSVETSLLLPLLSHAHPQRLLFIGGNFSEYLPYLQNVPSVKEVTCLEKDAYLINFQKKRMINQLTDSRIRFSFITDDVKTFFENNDRLFDIIYLNEPEPYTLSDNRLYSSEFYGLVGESLADSGIYFFSVKAAENYIHDELCNYLNLLQNTLNESFQQVLFIPGDEAFFLSGNSPYFIKNLENWSGQLQVYPVRPQFLTPAYMSYLISPTRLASFREQLQKCSVSVINRDFNLKGYFYHFQLWSGVSDPLLQKFFQFLNRNGLIMALGIILLIIILQLFLHRKDRPHILFQLFLAGGLSISLEILIILQFQILFGTIYSRVAIIFGLFMAGLAAGATQWRKISPNYRALFAAYTVISVSLLIPVALSETALLTQTVRLFFQWLVIPLQVFLTGWTGGRLFSVITGRLFELHPESSYGITYGMDLAGGVAAALTTSVVFVPLLGFSSTILLLAAISMIPFILA
jgi:spermidine synthase